jgi:putative FmdB family regulatory protein
MPTYVYECAKCGDEFELWQSFSDEPLKKHSGCGGKVTKVLQPVGIVLKGSGFYKTDNRGGSKSTGASKKAESSESSSSSSDSSSGSSSSSATSDTKKSDTKKADTKKAS